MYSFQVFHYEEIDSTNTEAKRKIRAGLSENALFIADKQTSGRGRHSKSFYSPGGGLYMTLAVRLKQNIDLALRITEKAAASVYRGIVMVCPDLKPQIKWVNDIYLYGKKVCGILVESVLNEKMTETEWVIVGIGVNLSNEAFPEELTDIAGSLTPGKDWGKEKREALINSVCEALFYELMHPEDKAYLEICRKNSCVLGEKISFCLDGKEYTGFAKDIDNEGHLIVGCENGEERILNSGEISVKPVNVSD